jgi:hypothetical protein
MSARATVTIILVLSGSACMWDDEPEVSRLIGCVGGAALQLSRGESRVQAECEVPEPWVLVGLPARAIEAREFTELGISPGLVPLLTGRSSTEPNWCVAREVATRSDTEIESRETARSRCTSAGVSIRELVHAGPGPVVLTFSQSESGMPVLTSLRSRN